jgi:hypothetical protein
MAWIACEDLQTPGGALVLVSSSRTEWFSKGYSPYGTDAHDSEYYLGIPNATVASAATDVLGEKVLVGGEPTWAKVEKAAPPIRKSGTIPGGWEFQTSDCDGMRTFVGSRDASVDFTFSDEAQDCSYNGSPSLSYAQNLHNKAVGEAPQDYNRSGIAEGMLGGWLPSAVFYFPVVYPDTSNCSAHMQREFCNFTDDAKTGHPLPPCAVECGRHNPNAVNNTQYCAKCPSCAKVLSRFCGTSLLAPTKQSECPACVASMLNASNQAAKTHRYWTYINVPKPDAKGNREQNTWMRMQQRVLLSEMYDRRSVAMTLTPCGSKKSKRERI